ncbi:hypothetical protein BOTCAL_0092g00180 [Botryotinia calthae]|uniref:Uncharacterized protein n=1 Tax=Botryotinia calthae TaxID=38488 RepID=A0A4Y8D6W1_9HELO|nr:hypothetical protein BOTCAL_0092g00180 [Botryotinia calthae]
MSRPTSIPPSRSTQVDRQTPRPRLENDSHDSDEGKAALQPSLYHTPPPPTVIKLKGEIKDMVTQSILKEQELETQEKAKIQEVEESNVWKFTSNTAGKMYLKLQDKDTRTFIDCNNFARDCEKAIRSDPRANSRANSMRKEAPAPSLSVLLTPGKKAQHLKRLDTLLTSKNRYAKYWTIEDLPSEWLKIDNEALCSKEEQALLIKEVEKKKKALEKTKTGGKVKDGKPKGHELPIHEVRRPSDDRQREGRQGPIHRDEVKGGTFNGIRRSSREKLDGRAHEERQLLGELENEGTASKNRPRIHNTKVNGKIKTAEQASISGDERDRIVVEEPRRNARTEIDERSKEVRRVPVEVGNKKMVLGDRSRIGNAEVDGRIKKTHRAPTNGAEMEQVAVEKPRAGIKVEDDSNFSEDQVLSKKRHGSAAIDEVGNTKKVATERSRNATAETNREVKDDSVPPKKRHGPATMDVARTKRTMAVDRPRNGKAETDGRFKDNSLPPKKKQGSQ